METTDLILLLVGKRGRVVPGRTALQKTAYFVSKALGADLGFKPHYYGPYSPTVAQTTDFLVATDFLTEEQESIAPGYMQYSYRLTKDGVKAAESARGKHPKEAEIVEAVVAACEKNAWSDSSVISWAAKTHFLLVSDPGKRWTVEEIIAGAREVGWKISARQIRKGAKLLVALPAQTA